MARSNDNDYPCIRAWDRMMGSYSDYISRNVQRAREEHAPENAIYWSETLGRWAILPDVTSVDTRWYFKNHHPELVSKYAPNWD